MRVTQGQVVWLLERKTERAADEWSASITTTEAIRAYKDERIAMMAMTMANQTVAKENRGGPEEYYVVTGINLV